jgi:glycosyltransferase involved in cell wall biosynthesis
MARDLILGLFPAAGGIGGIQQVCRHVGATLQEWAQRRGQRCELAGWNDPEGMHAFSVGDLESSYRGFARNRSALLHYLIARAARIDFLFVGHPNLGPAALWTKLLEGRLNLWIAAHGMEVWEPLPAVRRMALRQADGIWAISRHTAEAVERVQGVNRTRIVVQTPSLDPAYFCGNAEPAALPVPVGSKVLLTVGRILASEPGKGFDMVIRAMPLLLETFPNVYYVVVGDGDGRPALEKLATTCGVAEHVVFTGSRPDSIRGYYEAADIFVMPSRQEGFGIVYLEAMAAGKPVVAASLGGAKEVVADGETGFLVSYGDVDSLKRRLATLLADERLRRQMGEAGRRTVAEHYRFEAFRENLIGILEGCTNRKR